MVIADKPRPREDGRRTKNISVVLNDDELEQLDGLVAEYGSSRAAVVRWLIDKESRTAG